MKAKRQPAKMRQPRSGTAVDIGCSLQRLVRGQLRKDLHKFIDEIVSHCECPSMWPLTQQEQIQFVRKVIFQAREIRNTEEYLAESVAIAADELAKASLDP